VVAGLGALPKREVGAAACCWVFPKPPNGLDAAAGCAAVEPNGFAGAGVCVWPKGLDAGVAPNPVVDAPPNGVVEAAGAPNNGLLGVLPKSEGADVVAGCAPKPVFVGVLVAPNPVDGVDPNPPVWVAPKSPPVAGLGCCPKRPPPEVALAPNPVLGVLVWPNGFDAVLVCPNRPPPVVLLAPKPEAGCCC
jgi:hypothetical protein